MTFTLADQLPDLPIRTLADDAVDTTLNKIAAGRKVVIGEFIFEFGSYLLALPDQSFSLPR